MDWWNLLASDTLSSKDFHEFTDRLKGIEEKLADVPYSQKQHVAKKSMSLKYWC